MAENTPTQNKTAQNTCYLITICLFLERVSTRDMAVHKLSHTPVSRIWLHVRDTLPWRERKYSRTDEVQKKFWGIRTHDLRDTGAMLYQLSNLFNQVTPIPLEPQNFFRALRVEDHFHLYSLSAVYSYDLYHIHIMSERSPLFQRIFRH